MEDTTLVLRPEQEQAKRDIYRAINGGAKSVVLQAMTSFGKTALAASIVKDAMSRGVNVLFTAPMLTLIDQTLEEFDNFGIKEMGVIQADHHLTDYSKPVQICSVQTIHSITKKDPAGWLEYQKGKLIIFDECHLQYSVMHWMIEKADMPVIGLSATPWAKGMANHYDTLVQGPSTRWLIENKRLSEYRAYSHYVPSMKGVQVNASGDYSSKQAGEKYDKKIVGDIVRTWEKQAKGRKTILFAPRVADAQRFAEEFCMAGYRAVAVSGYMDREDCRREVDKFRDGHYDVIASVAKLATGFSVRDVGCIIDAQPTKSLMRHIQKLGRGLRTHPDKEDVIILDNAGNLLRNGLPDDEYPDYLDDGTGSQSTDRRKKEDEEKLPKPCPKCSYMKEPHQHICPNCGFEPRKQSTLEVDDGELVEIEREKRKKKLNAALTTEQKRQIYGALEWIRRDRGYQKGWESHKYRNMLGVWPNMVKKGTPIAPPRGWVADYLEDLI